MRRDPPTCPNCQTVVDRETVGRSRRPSPRARAQAEAAAPVKKPVIAELEAEEGIAAEPVEGIDEESLETETAEAEGDGEVIEDVSELGEDEDDMAEVLEGGVEPDEER
jgi:hypothetical protein